MESIRKVVRQMIRESYFREGGFPRAMQLMRGAVDSVDRLVIITAANPMARQAEASVNNRKMEELYSDLNSLGYGFIKMKGLYGVPEPSVLVNGMSRGEGFKLARKYKQQSYIFGYRKDIDGENSVMVYELIYPWDSSQNMTSRMTISNADVQDFDDFYSKVKGRKFQIPFYDEMLSSKQLPVGASEPVDIEPGDDEEGLTYRQKISMKGKAGKPYKELEKITFGGRPRDARATYGSEV